MRRLIGIVLLRAAACSGEDSIVPEPLYTRITVTAERGASLEAGNAAQVVTVVTPQNVSPWLPTLGHALEFAPGVLLQQTGPGQVSPFLRGFTGYHVLNLIDGVRYNNATFRSGPNQYLSYIQPAAAQTMEVVLGPASSQYGSDSLGGTISVRTPETQFTDGRRIRGDVAISGGSADRSGGGDVQVAIEGRRAAWLLGASGAKHNDLRPGSGVDSRDVFRRLFGVDGLIGPSLPGTAWSRRAIHTKASVALPRNLLLTGWYQRSEIGALQNYKDLFGGLGRLQSRLDPQSLDFGYLRMERAGNGALEHLSATFSVNSQADGTVRQGQRITDPVVRDRVRADAFGYSGQATVRMLNRYRVVSGADIHHENVDASRTAGGTPVRALYADGAGYRTFAGFAQVSTELAHGRVRLLGGGRATGVSYSAPEDAALGVASARQHFRDFTWHAAGLWQAAGAVGFHALASRGFRAPNLNDLGAIGLNDLGYEIPASEAAGAFIGSSAGEAAVSTGRPVSGLSPERLRNYEAGVRVRAGRFYTRVQVFHADLLNPIDRRTLLFPAGQVPGSVAGLPVTPIGQTPEQRAAGVVTVAAQSIDPRALKAFVNEGQYRYYGGENITEFRVNSWWSVRGNYHFLHGRQLNPNRFVRRLPPQQGRLSLLHNSGRGFWVELRATVTGRQDRLTGGDFDDERIGASRSRRDIASFFASATAAAWISDGIFTPTGETLAQIQQRVLPGVPSDTARVALYPATAGWARVDVLGGFRAGERTTIHAGIENLLDRNYRVHGSGVDGPGANLQVRIRYTF